MQDQARLPVSSAVHSPGKHQALSFSFSYMLSQQEVHLKSMALYLLHFFCYLCFLFFCRINLLHSTLNVNTKGIRWLVFVILLLFLGCLPDFCLTSAPPCPSPAAHGCADLPVFQSEFMDSFAQIPNPCPEAPVDTRQQERYDPRTQKTERTSPVMLPSPTRFSSAAVANTELQHQSRCSLEAEHISNDRCSGRPDQHKASEAIPKISMGRYYAFYPALYAFVDFVAEHHCFVSQEKEFRAPRICPDT